MPTTTMVEGLLLRRQWSLVLTLRPVRAITLLEAALLFPLLKGLATVLRATTQARKVATTARDR